MEDIDDGEVYVAMRIGPDAIPQRRFRLLLRKLMDAEDEAARTLVELLGNSIADNIADSEDWETVEGYITALLHMLYDKLQPFSQTQQHREIHPRQARSHAIPAQPRCAHQPPTPSSTDVGPSATVWSPSRRWGNRRHRGRGRSKGGTKGRHHPPRVTRHHRLSTTFWLWKKHSSQPASYQQGTPRVGRINASLDQMHLHHRFDTDEEACVEAILSR
ncbi:hypothetical protein PsorP6_017419 [Peronosclerospora sorghi]|uniref:Uncharacterized protein n=1 Tax=Peronosclerospora sorghi TaxID=230839 RepID=A0ACC0WNZ6_9STRA|nr:hypothetical protein PsorP6_017419 [Peronosclerospora sorghi]